MNGKCKITIGNYTRISPGVNIISGRLEFENKPLPYKHSSAPITIGEGVWIATNAIILGGVTIGDRSIIAASTIVNKDIPSDVVVGGIPAKILKTLQTPK
jgi:acetyltransferase-like isoleucine patch superfamily enzyme